MPNSFIGAIHGRSRGATSAVGLVVEFLLAMQEARVRFPDCAFCSDVENVIDSNGKGPTRHGQMVERSKTLD